MYSIAILEGCFTMNKGNVVTPNCPLDHLAFFFNNGPFPIHEVLDRQIFLERIVNAVQTSLTQTGEIQSRFAKRFGRNCPRVNTCASYMGCAFDECDAFPIISRFRSTFFPRRSGTNYDQIIFFGQIRCPNNLLNKSDSSTLLASQRCLSVLNFFNVSSPRNARAASADVSLFLAK